jgi:pimeloyl-ACP methyl ester carboxylesterase
MLRWIGRILVGLVVLIAAFIAYGFFFLADPVVPRETLMTKYGGAPSKFVKLPSGAEAHYRDQGNAAGLPLVLLHGSNASLHTWEPWAKILGDEFRVISVDLPAHGLTGPTPGEDYSISGMAKFVDEFATAIGLQTFALGGNSMGGAVTARYAIDYPQRVTKIILVDAGGFPPKNPSDPGIGFTIARMPIIREITRIVPLKPIYDEGLKKAFADDKLVTDEMVTRYWELNNGPGMREATRKRFAIEWDMYIADNAKKITAPTLVMWGEDDSLVPLDVGQSFDAAIPNSTLVSYKGIGHIPMEEVPAQSAADVRAFLAPGPAPQAQVGGDGSGG